MDENDLVLAPQCVCRLVEKVSDRRPTEVSPPFHVL